MGKNAVDIISKLVNPQQFKLKFQHNGDKHGAPRTWEEVDKEKLRTRTGNHENPQVLYIFSWYDDGREPPQQVYSIPEFAASYCFYFDETWFAEFVTAEAAANARKIMKNAGYTGLGSIYRFDYLTRDGSRRMHPRQPVIR